MRYSNAECAIRNDCNIQITRGMYTIDYNIYTMSATYNIYNMYDSNHDSIDYDIYVLL